MNDENRSVSDEQDIGYEVMNAAYSATATGLDKLYYCQPDSSKVKNNITLPSYDSMIRVVISK